MAKFVCDFEQVTSIGEKLCQSSKELESSISTYSSSMESGLSSWSGSAKEAFQNTNNELIQVASSDFSNINDLGEFIKKASSSIQSLEEELSNLQI